MDVIVELDPAFNYTQEGYVLDSLCTAWLKYTGCFKCAPKNSEVGVSVRALSVALSNQIFGFRNVNAHATLSK